MSEKTFSFKVKADDPLYKTLTEEIEKSGKNTQPYLADHFRQFYESGEVSPQPTPSNQDLKCRYATPIGSKVYCDDAEKPKVPRDRLVPLGVCTKCFNRKEALENQYTEKTLGLKHEDIKASQKPIETPQPINYNWGKLKTQTYEDTHVACPDKSDPQNGIKHYVEPKECGQCPKYDKCLSIAEFIKNHPHFSASPNSNPSPASSAPPPPPSNDRDNDAWYKAQRKTPRSGW